MQRCNEKIYPVPPYELARHLGFCLGNAVDYALRAPFENGVEDCDKALEYLRMNSATPQPPLSHFAFLQVRWSYNNIMSFISLSEGDQLWLDISGHLQAFLTFFWKYIEPLAGGALDEDRPRDTRALRKRMENSLKELRRVLALRDTTGQIYEGMSGLPQKEAQ